MPIHSFYFPTFLPCNIFISFKLFSASLIVEVIDVNENRFAPQFEDFVLMGSLKENQNPGTQVMKVIAKDIDIPGPDSRVSYSTIKGDGLGLFAIDNEGNFQKTN